MGMTNRNWILYFGLWNSQPKLTEMAGNQSVSAYFDFSWFSVFQREGYWERNIFLHQTEILFKEKHKPYFQHKIQSNTIKTQTLFSTQNTEQHIKNDKTQTKISSYKVSLKQTSMDDTKPMESQCKHGWFGMRETKSRRRHTESSKMC